MHLGLSLGVTGGGRGGARYPAQQIATLGDLYVARMGGGSGAGEPSQGFAIDEDAGKFYIMLQNAAGTGSRISRFRWGGARAQGAELTCADSADLGHQSIACETATGKMWGSDRTDSTGAIRFDFGATLANIERYVLFTGVTQKVGFDLVTLTISHDQQWLVAGTVLDTNETLIRVWTLADLVAGGPGDYSGAFVHQWTVPAGVFTSATYPFQALASDGESVTLAWGFGDGGDPFKIRTYSLSGNLLAANDSAPTSDRRWVTTDASGGTIHFEPEGLAYATVNGRPVLHLLTSQGVTPNRINRIWRIGQPVTRTAAELTALMVAACTAAGSTPTAGMEAAYLGLYSDLLEPNADGYCPFDYLSALYPYCAEAEAQALINIADPGQRTLTKVGSPTFTAKQGFTGTGATTAYLTTGVTWAEWGNYGRNTAMWFGHCNTAAADTGSALGTLSGAFNFLHTRNGSDQAQTRLNQTTAVNSIAGVTDGSGLWTARRFVAASYSVERNGTALATPAEASAGLSSSNAVFLRGATSATSGQWALQGFGYAMPDDVLALFKTALDNFRAACAAL